MGQADGEVNPAAGRLHERTGEMAEAGPPVGAVGRAVADARDGDRALARRRLRDRLRVRPTDLAARRLLAQLYRADGYRDQAGRWGYLVPGVTTGAERNAFLSGLRSDPVSGRYRRPDRWVATRTLALLGWPADEPHPDPGTDRLLRELRAAAAGEAAANRSLGEKVRDRVRAASAALSSRRT